jgi:hypothetical protein
MRYYITYPVNEDAKENDYRIVKVQQADEANFLQDYGDQVIASGSSLMEALLNFEQVKKERQ